jgi:nucleoside 2-deoxyribosyltransferase
MSFSDALNDIWEFGIKQAVEMAGYRPYRIDKDPHNERIDSKIISEIKNSRFLIADVTEQKPGVYYEAGFAQGLNRQVIWSVRENDLENVHFDTRQFGHVVWKDIKDLRRKLYEMICAVVGKNIKGSEATEKQNSV